jgi:hypothetical protein
MKRHLLLIPMILATSAAIADAQTTAPSAPADAQAQAAALFSRPHAIGTVKADARSPSPVSAPLDAHQSAAALLSGTRSKNRVNAVSEVAESPDARVSTDAQAQAAALLSGSRLSRSRTKLTHSDARTIGPAS